MARAAYIYDNLAHQEALPRHNQPRRNQPQLKVLQGSASQRQTQSQAQPNYRKLFAIALVVVAVVGTIWMVRVGFAQATMAMTANSAQVSNAIAAERLAGTQLEVEYSKVTAPASVKEAAAGDLKMVPDERIEYLRLSDTAGTS